MDRHHAGTAVAGDDLEHFRQPHDLRVWAGQLERASEPVHVHTCRALRDHSRFPRAFASGLYNVYIDEANTTPLMGNGPNDAFQTASGLSLGTDEATTTVNVSIRRASRARTTRDGRR